MQNKAVKEEQENKRDTRCRKQRVKWQMRIHGVRTTKCERIQQLEVEIARR